jgi:hypothetical protein
MGYRLTTMVRANSGRARGVALAMVVALGAAALGCERQSNDTASAHSAAPPQKLAPVPLVWEHENQLKSERSSVTFVVTTESGQVPLQLQGTFRNWPRNTTFLLGKEQGRGADGSWFTSLDITQMVHAQPLDSLRGPVDLRVPVVVVPPEHAPAATMLPALDVRGTLRLLLLQVRRGGLTFGANDTPLEKPRGVAVVSGKLDLNFVGTGKTTRELDWIAVAEDQNEPSGRKSCIYEIGGLGLIRFYDTDMTLFDRRSGKKIGSGVIHKRPECPGATFIDQERWAHSSVPTQDIIRWTESQLKKALK